MYQGGRGSRYNSFTKSALGHCHTAKNILLLSQVECLEKNNRIELECTMVWGKSIDTPTSTSRGATEYQEADGPTRILRNSTTNMDCS
jgi:hypothetical protein